MENQEIMEVKNDEVFEAETDENVNDSGSGNGLAFIGGVIAAAVVYGGVKLGKKIKAKLEARKSKADDADDEFDHIDEEEVERLNEKLNK